MTVSATIGSNINTRFTGRIERLGLRHRRFEVTDVSDLDTLDSDTNPDIPAGTEFAFFVPSAPAGAPVNVIATQSAGVATLTFYLSPGTAAGDLHLFYKDS